jgi:hypothetical protein
MAETRTIQPQPGYQTKALSSSADIVIGGAAAGVGKTYTLLLDPLRDIKVPGFGGVIFRRTSTQIRNEGGLWDTSMDIYPHVGAEPKETFLEWNFPKGAKIKFSHLEHEKIFSIGREPRYHLLVLMSCLTSVEKCSFTY